MRRCPVTATTLPSFFLQRFTLRPHPGTGAVWVVPSGYETKVPGMATDTTGLQTGPGAYILSRQRLLQDFQRQSSVYFNQEKKLFRMSDHGHNDLGAVLNKSHWLSDMDNAVLELMRRRITEDLVHYAQVGEVKRREGKEYVVRRDSWEKVRPMRSASIVYLGPTEPASSETIPPEEMPSESALSRYDDFISVPPKFSTIPINQCGFRPPVTPGSPGGEMLHGPTLSESKHDGVPEGPISDPTDPGEPLAIHNLALLLGTEHIRQLRLGNDLLSQGSLFLLHRRATLNVRMLLWKLQGYLAPEESKF